jgi:cellobiose phosphorylase
LPLIGVGDWNDGMNMVGDEGKGVSVWLGFFLHEVLRRFEPLAERMGDGERARRYAAERFRLQTALNGPGWDGAWYRRAMTDEGDWLGSVHNRECRIDAIAQSWAVISGAGEEDKCRMAMESLDRELVDRELSVIRLLTPPFEHTDPSPGYIQGYPPGIRENGAQYTHGVLWSIGAWSMLGRGDKAFEMFRMLNPINHARTESEVRRYCGEPYVMAADVYTGEPHAGRAGWTWYTGAAGWMYRLGLEAILGIRMKEGRLHIRPCIPPEWREFTVRYRYGGSEWRIDVKNPDGRSTGIRRLAIDGEEARPAGADREDGALLTLTDDGKTHVVELVLGEEDPASKSRMVETVPSSG